MDQRLNLINEGAPGLSLWGAKPGSLIATIRIRQTGIARSFHVDKLFVPDSCAIMNRRHHGAVFNDGFRLSATSVLLFQSPEQNDSWLLQYVENSV